MIADLAFLKDMVFKGIDVAMEERRRITQNRERHLENIKSGVLNPIAEQLERYFDGACRGRSVLIRASVEQLSTRPKSVLETRRTESFYKIEPTTPGYEIYYYAPHLYSPGASGINKGLYDHCVGVHYRELLDRWQIFRSRFDSIVRSCIAVAEAEARRLQGKTTLRQSKASDSYSEPGANFIRLAVFEFDRVMEQTPYALKRERPDGVGMLPLTIDTERVAYSKEAEKIDGLIHEVEEGIGSMTLAVHRIKRELESLHADVAPLLLDFKNELNSFKGLEECDFVS